MAHAEVRARGAAGRVTRGRTRRRGLDLATTPGRLWLVLIGLVLLSLAWGALAAFTATQYSAAAASVVSTREPLSLDAQRIYSTLSDANDAATTAFLAGGLEPPGEQQRYLADLAAAETGLEDAVARGGAGHGATATDLRTLATDIRLYDGEVATARADSRLGLPLGAAYLREASGLMRTLLAKAKDLYATENANLSDTSAQATGLPLAGGARRRTASPSRPHTPASPRGGRRAHQPGAQRWACSPRSSAVVGGRSAGCPPRTRGARSDLLDAQARGSATVEAIARVGIAVQEAHGDESLTLIDNTGKDSYQDRLRGPKMRSLGPGPRERCLPPRSRRRMNACHPRRGGGGDPRRAGLVRGARARSGTSTITGTTTRPSHWFSVQGQPAQGQPVRGTPALGRIPPVRRTRGCRLTSPPRPNGIRRSSTPPRGPRPAPTPGSDPDCSPRR